MDTIQQEKLIKKSYISSFSPASPEIAYLLLIGTKVIVGVKGSARKYIDVDRLYDEFVYFRHYSNMTDDYLLNFTLPMVIANRSYDDYLDTIIEMVDKLTRFYKIESLKYDYILDQYIYDMAYRHMMANNLVEALEFLYKIKDRVIEYNPLGDNKKENIHLQMKKISYIEDLHAAISYFESDEEQRPNIKSTMLDIIMDIYLDDDVDRRPGEESVRFCLMSLVDKVDIGGGVFGKDTSVEDGLTREKDPRFSSAFIDSMADYVLKLRNNQVSTRRYRDRFDKKSSPKQILSYSPGQEFIDQVLNKCKVIDKKYEGMSCTVHLATKTGDYKFVFKGRGANDEK